MCRPDNVHPDFDANLDELATHPLIGGVGVSLIGAAVGKIERAQTMKRPIGLTMRNVTASSGISTTLHYWEQPDNFFGMILCLADDMRDGTDYCLNLVAIDYRDANLGWTLYQDPYVIAADRAI